MTFNHKVGQFFLQTHPFVTSDISEICLSQILQLRQIRLKDHILLLTTED